MTNYQKDRLGSFEIITIQDLAQHGDSKMIAMDIDDTEREQVFENFGDDPAAIPVDYNCLLIDTGQQKILIDAGFGEDDSALMPALKANNVEPEDIDLVVLTHAHGDHYSGMTTKHGELVFKNAPHLVWAAEWAYWTDEANLATMDEARVTRIRQRMMPIEPNLKLIDASNVEIAPGITAIPAFGHTPYHIAVMIESDGEARLFVSDAMIHPLNGNNPHWRVSFDYNNEQAAGTRRQLLAMAYEYQAQLQAYHFAFPGIARVVRTETGSFRLQ